MGSEPGDVVHGGETDCPRNGCSLRETEFLPPHLTLAEKRAVVSSACLIQNCQTLSDVRVFGIPVVNCLVPH